MPDNRIERFIEWLASKLRSKCKIHKCDFEVGQAPEEVGNGHEAMFVCPQCAREGKYQAVETPAHIG